MKTAIISLNSKFIHSSLAPWYLKASCGAECGEVTVIDYTINDSLEAMLESIYLEKPDVAAFSCYIWNISMVLKLVRDLKKVLPYVTIILGGPEVSYDADELLKENKGIDYIISGEGEMPFRRLLSALSKGKSDIVNIPGLSFRLGREVKVNRPLAPGSLDNIPTPYTEEMLASIKDKIIYFESSRGCPFSCSYCLSSKSDSVRYFPLERVGRELERLYNAGVRQVKFVDRTFNCNKARALEIFRFIISMVRDSKSSGRAYNPDINFHFEAAADLFDDEVLDLLATAPKGLFQLEIGVQTFNTETLDAIRRKTDLEKVSRNTSRIIEQGNIHIHLDLIAGLPFENYASFRSSFDSVYGLRPHKLQLGFLKMLKGTEMRSEAENCSIEGKGSCGYTNGPCTQTARNDHGYKFRDYPPYEVLQNRYVSFDEIIKFKHVEELVERYFNSGRFIRTLDFVTRNLFDSAFDFYLSFASFLITAGRTGLSPALKDLYGFLYDYVKTLTGETALATVKEFMRFDFLASESSGRVPAVLSGEIPTGFRDRCFEFLRDEKNIERYLPDSKGVPAKQIFKRVHFEYFIKDISQNRASGISENPVVVLFNYNKKDSVSGLFQHSAVQLTQ